MTMIRTRMLCQFALLAIVALAAVPAKAAEQASRPNVVVFLVDDMGLMDTSLPFLTDADGNPKRYPLNDFYRTPGMERLARRGIQFNNFYAMSVCSPTRISIMTGQNAARHHATNWINPRGNNRGPFGPPDWNWKGLTKESITLPGLLQKAGYRTIHVGKGHFGPNDTVGSEPLNLGFDVNVGGASFGAPGSYYAKLKFGRGTRRAHHAVPHLDKYHGSETFLTEALTIEAKSRVTDAVKANQPFYLYMSHYAVHAPFESDPRFAAHYENSDKPKNAKAFATLIEGMDKSLGDLLDHLDELGVSDNTLVLFLGDNGSDSPLGHEHAVASAAPLRGKKGAHYEGGMRVPFIAAWAKADSGKASQKQLPVAVDSIQNQTANVTDLFPTILDLIGPESPTDHPVDGSSLNTLLTGKPDASRTEEFLMHYPHAPHRSDYWTSYRNGDWKVIYHYYPSKDSEDSRYQLYNLADDPFESTNLADSKPDQLRALMKGLIISLNNYHAQYPVAKADNSTPLMPLLP